MKNEADFWVKQLQLIPHPEGGYYAETYKAMQQIEGKPCSSLIYFLLKGKDISTFHKLKSDEVWMFHGGSSTLLYLLEKDGSLVQKICGPDIENNEHMQVLIRANTWFAAELTNKTQFSLMSCMVSPGFCWDGFEMGKAETLIKKYPVHHELIQRLCKY